MAAPVARASRARLCDKYLTWRSIPSTMFSRCCARWRDGRFKSGSGGQQMNKRAHRQAWANASYRHCGSPATRAQFSSSRHFVRFTLLPRHLRHLAMRTASLRIEPAFFIPSTSLLPCTLHTHSFFLHYPPLCTPLFSHLTLIFTCLCLLSATRMRLRIAFGASCRRLLHHPTLHFCASLSFQRYGAAVISSRSGK